MSFNKNWKNDLLSSLSGKGWNHIKIKNHHGINIPLFSIRTKESAGIGEYLDLILAVDLCKKTNFDILQILPINDTGFDPSPYSSISAFALNPIHISLSQLPLLEDVEGLIERLQELQSKNLEQRIDYPFLHQKKDEFFHIYFQNTFPLISQKVDYQRFVNENDWLMPYALFKTIKIIRQWQPVEKWPQNLKEPSLEEITTLYKEYETQISYHIFLQYLCFSQLKEVRLHAITKNVFLKGDIPILMNKESADVWQNRCLFNNLLTAGAPPDMYSAVGQNWQFPIYNWKEMEHHDYSWWKLRLEVASQFYDLFRLDHIVGFFRIWAISLGLQGVDGHFLPPHENEWVDFGKKNLSQILKNTPMLPIGEDLGAVTENIREALKSLGICGTKVMRWERYWNGDKSFIPVKDYIKESMTTVSTHDSETLRQWWLHEPEEAKEYAFQNGWSYENNLLFETHFAILKESHKSASLFHINLLNEYIALIEGYTWDDPADERINDPSFLSDRNWTYRFKPYLEEINNNDKLLSLMKNLSEQ